MPISEAARHDLYNGLTELLGPERADTLMAYLPTYDPVEIATKSTLTAMESRLVMRIDRIDNDLAELRSGQAAINLRLDRLFLTLLAGLLVVVAAMAGLVLAVG